MNHNRGAAMEKLWETINEIIQIIENEKRTFNNRELINLCHKYVQTQNGETDQHIYHEIAETALNTVIKKSCAQSLLASPEPVKIVGEIIKPLAARLPTQTWRSREQVVRQQFSTPPAVAYFLCYLLNLRRGEHILEPSAGTGSLAVWASAAGAQTHTNEIDARRRALLESLGFAPTAYNAEFINDYLPPEIEIDCLLMNPPFSTSGGRTANNSSKFGFRHVESALERLKKGGRCGIILGEAAGLDAKTGNDFRRKLSDRIMVRTVVKISGREYYKNGTTVDINLITGEKLLEVQKTDWNKVRSRITSVSALTVEEAFEKAQNHDLRLI